MKLRNNIFTTLLLTIGFVLHQITPGILGGMKFDFLIIFMIVSILLNSNFENIMLSGLLARLLSAITTTFPGGQLPNVIDKIITCLILFIVIKYINKFKSNPIIIGLIGSLGTFLSGTIFLVSAFFIVGLPVPMNLLIISVVIPTTIINGIGTVFIYKITKKAMELSGVTFH